MFYKIHLFKFAIMWGFVSAIISVLTLSMYVAVQQDMRIGANDPQIQLSEDAARLFAQGKNFQTVLPITQIDIAKSLSPFLAVYNDAGQAVASSGLLNGDLPKLPGGVFAYTKLFGQDRFTWQPELGVRQAVVLTYYQNNQIAGYVMASRSLREVEYREGFLSIQVGLAWLACVLIAFLGSLLYAYDPRG